MNGKSFFFVSIFTLLTVVVIALDESVGGFLAPLRIFLSLAFIVFLPGYALQAALLPRPGSLSWLERLALSIGMSVAIIAPPALIFDGLGFELRLWPVTVSLSIFTVLCAGIAFLCWGRLPKDRTVPVNSRGLRQWWAGPG